MLDSTKYQPKEEVGIQHNELKTNGFYYSKQQAGSKRYISPIVLYENGPVLLFDNFGNSSSPLIKTKNGKECSLETGQDHETIIEFFECYLEMVDFKTIHSVFFVKDSQIHPTMCYLPP